ncbi:hypothetical protein GPDM_02320 [Planococcus donghaensis MPA1U2]|uniref:Uncharacterized protein n=1 Tax=Planococcus donghaensis MPA1U2 TaxID=933115 RepID=E7RDD6_9BACL|nr:hypothetical protein GPDM_02320 [Planococcus donghaensis MPA1U2]
MKNIGLKMIWIIPNVLLYLLAIGILWFIFINAQGLQEINNLEIWVLILLLLLLVNFFGSYKIVSWIKQRKM